MPMFIKDIQGIPVKVCLEKIGKTTKIIVTINKEVIFTKKYFGLSYVDLVISNPWRYFWGKAYLRVRYLRKVESIGGNWYNAPYQEYEELDYDWETKGN